MDGYKEQQKKPPERGETLKLSEVLRKKEFDKLFIKKMKKAMKNFVMKNKYSTFVAFLSGTTFLTFVCVVFFIATSTALNAVNIGDHSIGYCTAKSVIVPDRTERGRLSLFYCFIFHSMSGTMKNYNNAKHSNVIVTSNGTKSVSTPETLIERNAKNRAYYFILRYGLFEQFREFCSEFDVCNYHADCINYFTNTKHF